MFYKREKKPDLIFTEKKPLEHETVLWLTFLEGVMTLAAAVFFLLAVKKCLVLLFPAQKFPKHFVIYAFYACIPCFLFKMSAKVVFPAHRRMIYPVILVLYVAVVFWLTWKNKDSLWVYGLNLVENYLVKVNSYYRLHMTVGGDLQVSDNRFGILFFGIVCYLCCLVPGVLWAKKHLLAVPAVFCIFFMMAVGQTPSVDVFSFCFAGMVVLFFQSIYRMDGVRCGLAESGWWSRAFLVRCFTFFLIFLLAAGIPVFSAKFLKKPAEKIMDYVPVVKEFQMELENTVENVLFSRFEKEDGVVDNEAPHYTGTEVLEISIKGKAPKENQYFRGFYGTDYVNGNWVNDDEEFVTECEKAGYSAEKMSGFLAFPANSYFQRRRSGIETFPESKIKEREITLSYKGLRGGYVYLPYMLGSIRGTGEAEFKQDTYLEKDTFQKKFHFVTWDPAHFEDTTRSYLKNFAEIDAIYSDKNEEEKEWKEWYERYVDEHYLNRSSGTGEEISVPAKAGLALYRNGAAEEGDEETERFGIWKLTSYLQKYFQTFEYSLELPEISSDTDPVSYFLKTSHKGYCMHFASAAVMILREMGIPARFASGYVVHPGNWKKGEDGTYTAKIPDSNAHAWAEVYFYGIGWFPIEFTPGNSEEPLRTAEKKTEDETVTAEEQQAETAEEQKEELSSEVLETPEPDASAVPSAVAEQNTSGNAPERKGSVQKVSSAGSYRLLALLFLFMIPVLVWLFRSISRRFFRKKRKFRSFKEFRRSQNRADVCKMNRRIYKRLCRKRHLLKRKLTDTEYGHLLQNTYPQTDWGEFMRIVKKASFSKDEVTEEEVACCHDYVIHVLEHNAVR